jgi:CHAT domain-containing protein
VLSLDGPLYELPFAALSRRTGTRSEYLIERHSLRVIPAIEMLGWSSGTAGWTQRFVAVGDAIYNGADPRRKSTIHARSEDSLARLPGSADEIRKSAEAWGIDKEPVLLTGRAVNEQTLRDALQLRPAVLHFATHVVKHAASPDQVLIALGLQDNGEAGYLGPAEVASMKHAIGLVTLSGCGSGQGSALPGLGLFGLTRAWLMAGARSVAATYWPIADDDGRLVSTFYQKLRQLKSSLAAPEVAEAMRQAQIEMLQSGGPRAHPAYWAAFFVLGKE